MANFGRTKDNKERLKLKSFFKRFIPIFLLPGIESLRFVNSDMNNAPKSSGASRKSAKDSHGITYRLKALKFYRRMSYYPYDSYYQERCSSFKTAQLIGKVLVIDKKQYRVVQKL